MANAAGDEVPCRTLTPAAGMKKRDFRQLWITRISAACKANGMNYSTFMHGLKLAERRDQPQDAG